MSAETIGVLITFAAYLVLLVVIGMLGERRHSKSYKDFVSADKSLGGLATALSAAASSESVWVMLGLSGLGYWKGVAALWAAIGCVIGFLFNALFITVQLRRESARLGSLTVSDYIEDRLGDRSKILRLVSAILISFFMVCYVVAQFSGAGKLFSGMDLLGEGTPYEVGVLIGAGIVTLYMFMGGYAAVCWTDTVQGILMFLVMLGLPILALVEVGGFSGISEVLGPLGLLSMSGAEGLSWAALGFIVGQLGIGLGYPGMPHMIVRYITVRDDVEARRAAYISVVWSVVVLFGSTTLGITVRALYPELAVTDKEAEALVLPHFCRMHLHPLLTGVVLSAVTAAIMSTADSQLMYAATSLVNDLWLKVRKGPPPSEKTLVWTTRFAVLGLALVAMGFALFNIPLIYTFVLFAWGGLGSAFGPVIILSLYWRGLTRWGALASFILGPLTVVVWHYIPTLSTAVYELIPGFAVSFVAAVVVSLLTADERPS
jgi:sodium/proline symporter